MIKPHFLYHRLADGTLRTLNPVVAEEVWYVPGRASRPITNERRAERHMLEDGSRPEDGCHFCAKNIFHTPAEKSRVIRQGASFRVLEKQTAEQSNQSQALFRRVPNLFEIVPF